jgi:hypothetical protein
MARCGYRVWLSVVMGVLALPLLGQQQSQPTKGADDEAGFVPLFDGKTLTGWEGDPAYWRVENGTLVGEIVAGKEIKENTFITYRGGAEKGVMKDFEIKLEYKITERGNSGINYRSGMVEGKQFAMKGYQFDIDGPLKNPAPTRHTGNNYEERGRTFMAVRGQITRATEGGKRQVIGAVGDYAELAKAIKNDDWNSIHLIVRGNTMVHLLNGQVMCVLVDDDPAGRAMEGLLGMQVHVGPPMKVEYRNVRMKKL